MKGGRDGSDEECLCILQLTEAGDIFYQALEPEECDAPPPPAAQDQSSKYLHTYSELVVPDTFNSEHVVGPSQVSDTQGWVAETPQRAKGTWSSDSDSEGSHSQAKGSHCPWYVKEVGTDEGVAGAGPSGPSTLQPVGKVSSSTLLIWKRWLHKLMKRPCKKTLHRHWLMHTTVDRGGFLCRTQDVALEEHMQSLGCHLRQCMSRGSVLVHSSASGMLQPLDLVPMPSLVEEDTWTDPLSQRLTVSWQGKAAWKDWWDDHLGRNKEAKAESLRRRRRREKAARRASGRSLDLSGSFTSSTTYQSEWDSFSDSAGWSSAASQGTRSNMDDVESPSESCGENWASRSATPSSTHMDYVASTPASRTQSVKELQETPSSSQALSLAQPTDSICSSQKRRRRLADDYLSSLFSTQVRGRWCPQNPVHHVAYDTIHFSVLVGSFSWTGRLYTTISPNNK